MDNDQIRGPPWRSVGGFMYGFDRRLHRLLALVLVLVLLGWFLRDIIYNLRDCSLWGWPPAHFSPSKWVPYFDNQFQGSRRIGSPGFDCLNVWAHVDRARWI